MAPGGPSGGRLGRQEARPEVVLGVRSLEATWDVRQRPPGTSGGPSGGRLGRQETRPERQDQTKAVWAVRRPVQRSSGPPGAQNACFPVVLLQNAGFAQAAGRAQAAGGPAAAKFPRRQGLTAEFLHR